MNYKYLPGMRPIPMLMYNNQANEDVFNEIYDEQEKSFQFGQYTDKNQHLWNIGAYIIYNKQLEIIAYKISDYTNLIWLLRILNQEIKINFDDKFVNKNSELIKESEKTKELIKIT